MADNVVANAGSGGATFASDDIGGVQYPRTKLTLGADGVTDGDVSSTNPLPISGPVTVSGVATSAKQDTGNTSLASIDSKITAVNTGAVVVSSSTLPSGASTAAKQPALGTAGLASADVITVQGIASMTALKVDGSAVAQPITDNSGSLTVDNGGTFAVQAAQSGTWNVGTLTTLSQWAGNAINLGTGTTSTGTLRIVLATDQPQLTNKLLVTPDANSAVNISQMNGVTVTMGNGTSGTGVQRVTLASDSTGQVALTSGAQVQAIAGTTGGLSFSVANPSANSNNKTQAKATAGLVYFISIQNISSAPVYLKIFDKTSANVTAGTTACDYQFMCPANGTAANGAGVVFNFEPGITHANAITWLLTTGISATDNTSVAANIALVTLGYK